jgi:hypothetical protein
MNEFSYGGPHPRPAATYFFLLLRRLVLRLSAA